MIIEDFITFNCPKCGKRLSSETDVTKTHDFGQLVKGVALPMLAACFGLSAVRPSYLICTNKECECCYSVDRPFYFKLNIQDKPVPVLRLGEQEPPEKKRKKLF